MNNFYLLLESNRLLIAAATHDDSGNYRCHARNDYSQAFHEERIEVQGIYVPPNCTDSPFFANCKLIVTGQYCRHQYYAKFCCKSCTQAGQLDTYYPNMV